MMHGREKSRSATGALNQCHSRQLSHRQTSCQNAGTA